MAGEVFRMRNWTHYPPLKRGEPGVTQASYKVDQKDKVAVMVVLGEENKDGSGPLDLEKAMNDIGWFRK